jgi:hypothetical protein
MATSIYGRALPNQTYSGTQHLVRQASPSNWTYNPGAGSYTFDGKKYGRPAASQPQNIGKDYLGIYNKLGSPTAGQVEGGAAQGFFYNPTGKPGGFQSLTPSALDNPEVYKSVRDRYLQFGNDPVWLEQLNKASDAARKGFEGGSFTMDPGVLQKMWK